MGNLISVIADIQTAKQLLENGDDDNPDTMDTAIRVLNHAVGDLDNQLRALEDERDEG